MRTIDIDKELAMVQSLREGLLVLPNLTERGLLLVEYYGFGIDLLHTKKEPVDAETGQVDNLNFEINRLWCEIEDYDKKSETKYPKPHKF